MDDANRSERDPMGESDERAVEVSDLQEPARGGGGAPSWLAEPVRMPRAFVVAGVALIVALALLSSPMASALTAFHARLFPPVVARSTPTATPPPTPAASPTPSPYPTATLVASARGAVPADCPASSPLMPFDTAAIVPGIGAADVWIVGPFDGPLATAHLGGMPSWDYTTLGWPLQIQALVASTDTQQLTLTGSDVRTGYPLWFQTGNTQPAAPPTPTLTIDPTALVSSTGDGNWLLWFGALYVPGAGCYALHATSQGGAWTVHFAAGR